MPRLVSTSPTPLAAPVDVDVAVCGGTLGVFLASALAARGLTVAVVERGPLRGRAQEWNVSQGELDCLVAAGAVSRADADAARRSSFGPTRVAVHGAAERLAGGRGAGGPDVEAWARGVLDLGVAPDALVAAAAARVGAAPGCRVLAGATLTGVDVCPDGARLSLEPSGAPTDGRDAAPATLTARLVVDCLGNASPLAAQARDGARPDGACLVVGTVASGYGASRLAPSLLDNGDVLATDSDLDVDPDSLSAQLFWEAFPSATGPDDRTTYAFVYARLDGDGAPPPSLTLTRLFSAYLDHLGPYQGLDDVDASLTWRRALFGAFPAYRDAPLASRFDRILHAGDAGGQQSPLSFGGFGALGRHAQRIANAVEEAVLLEDEGGLSRSALAAINPYSPGLSAAWLFQRAMSAGGGRAGGGGGASPSFVNRLLGGAFAAMGGGARDVAGDPSGASARARAAADPTDGAPLRPFLQDVLRFGDLASVLARQVAADPLHVGPILANLGPTAVAAWTGHFAALGAYTALGSGALAAGLGRPASPPADGRRRAKPAGGLWGLMLRRAAEGWVYGAGLDWEG